MKKLAWITDSTCGLSEKFIQENDIHVVPLNVIVNGQSYKENIDLTAERFYEKMKEENTIVQTSQPAFGDFIQLFEKLKNQYEQGIAIHASSALTGTFSSAKMAAKQTGFHVNVIDSKIGAYALGEMLKKGIKKFKEGFALDQLTEIIRNYTNQTEMYLLPSSFEQLKKSGRVSTSQAIFANLLNIHLLLKFNDGKVVVADKIRTKKRAKNRLFEIIEQAVKRHNLDEICLMHAGVKEKAIEWKEELECLHEKVKVKIETLVPVAGVHTGHGTMAVSWLYE